jgi:hypothetical protein
MSNYVNLINKVAVAFAIIVLINNNLVRIHAFSNLKMS